MPPSVIDAVNSHRHVLDNLDRSQASRLLGEWVSLARGLSNDIDALALEMAERHAQGLPTKLWHLQRMDRYQKLMGQIQAQTRQYVEIAVGDVTHQQARMVELGLTHSQQMLNMSTPGLTMEFDRLPVSAFVGQVGNTGAGTPLGSLFAELPRETAQQATQALLKGTGLGWNPRKTAQAMKNNIGLTYQRSLLIARTEQNRVYREATRQQYMASNIVEGYRRVASKTARTCIACLMMDGRFFPLSVPFEEHPNGRCVAVPVVMGGRKIEWESGEDWFRRQDDMTQRQIMGPGAHRAWRNGEFDLADIVSKRVDNKWGNSYVPTPLGQLVSQ